MGFFEDDVNAYSVELKPLKKRDLKPLTTSKGLFNKFAEILRHNNISDNANAFNKMLSLILCKIVDEDEKRPDDVLDFQIIEGLTDEKHIDKFQRLYKDGMAKFLGIKDFVYHSDEEIEQRIKDFPKRTPLEEILQFFKDIKYYTDKTFAFKEVYNQKLFKENAQVLKEVVELIQFYQFKNTRKNQILGDFFELLLNHGVKQSEGQFFTPLPIVKYMVQAIDFESLQAEKERINPDYPLLKTLDYACGAGHFLIEAIDKIEEINQKKNLGFDVDTWTKQYIFGIEKDYRLARTSKIACFLNGDGEANIIYGDGLKKHPELEEDIQKFDLILTNPPYSVKQFKNYVELNPADYELFDEFSEKASEIEVLFIERAKQALRPGGRAGIILPSSILSNTGIYTKAREVILKYFEIKAITELGNKTFIATGTNTVILFLQRREDKYPIDYKRVVDEIFDEYKFFDNDYIHSKELLDAFIEYRDLPDYHDFLQNNIISEQLAKTEVFEAYKEWFDNLTEIKGKNGLKTKKWFKDLTPQEQEAELQKRYIEKIKRIEKEKFYYFLLTYGQQTVIVKSPTATAEQKAFLGYEFNKKRGFEGIEIYTDAEGKPTTKLYDPETDNPAKADYYVRRSFRGERFEIDPRAQNFVKQLALTDMLDFKKVDFEKIINTNAEQKIKIQSKWPLVRLGEITNVFQGLTFDKKDQVQNNSRNIILTSTNIDLNKKKLVFDKVIYLSNDLNIDNKYLLKKGDIFIATSSGSISHLGKNVFIDRDTNYYFGGFCAVLRGNNFLIQKYISLLLSFWEPYKLFIKQFKGQNINNLKTSNLEKFKIPLPPKEVQEKIVSEIEALEKREQEITDSIEEKKEAIFEMVHSINTKKKLKDICNISTEKILPSNYPHQRFKYIGLEHIEKDTGEAKPVEVFGHELKSTKNVFHKNNVLYGKLRPYLNKVYLADCDGVCSTDILVLQSKIEPVLLKYILLDKNFVTETEKFTKGNSLPRIKPSDFLNIEVPVPPLSEQERIVAHIRAIEKEIDQLKTELQNIKTDKQNILDKYLK